MNTTPQPAPQSTPERPGLTRSQGASAVAIGIAIIGGIALISVGATAAIAATGSVAHQSRTPGSEALQTVDVAGVTELTVNSSAAQFELLFADTDEARLEVIGTAKQEWRMERRGDELVVRSDRGWLNFGGCFFGCNISDQQAVLTLPANLAGKLDANLSVGAGSLSAAGDFRDLELEVAAGNASATGSARSLSASLSAGRADLQLSGVADASFEVSAGKLTAELSRVAPDEVELEVSAGSLELTLVDVPYRVESDVAAGRLTNGLQASSSSAKVIAVSLAAGEVVLRPSAR